MAAYHVLTQSRGERLTSYEMPKGFDIPITLAEYDLIVENIKKEHETELIALCDDAQIRVNQVYADVIKFGIETNGREILYVLDSKSGKSLGEPILGEKGYVDSEELKVLLKTSEPNRIITIHNHANNASFSINDMHSAEKYQSVALTSAVGHDGSIYELRIGNNNRQVSYKQLSMRYRELLKELPVINDYSVFNQLEREQMLRNDVIEIICAENGWEYRRAYYYEESL